MGGTQREGKGDVRSLSNMCGRSSGRVLNRNTEKDRRKV